MAKEYAVTRCPYCGASVALAQDKTFLCANCGRGTLKPCPEHRIRWIPEEDLLLSKKTLVLSRGG